MFLPSSDFHDSVQGEGEGYKQRAEEHVKQYREEIQHETNDTSNIADNPVWTPATNYLVVPSFNTRRTTETLSSQEEGSTSEYGHEPLAHWRHRGDSDDDSPTDTEGAASYSHGSPLTRMPGMVKGFDESMYYHHQLYPRAK
jgi:hypothetical protein